MAQPLANKYRPKTFADVSEQDEIKVIIENQIKNNDLRSAYLFCGGAGTGKTTCARIVANLINNGEGEPVELDAASNNSVDDVRSIINDTKFKSLTSKYKIYIIDECHSLSNAAWQAMLKLLEETPTGVLFIFCTTDPQKIPGTILSYDDQAVEYIAKQAQGGMRDAITTLDKCLSFSKNLTLSNVVKVLSAGVTPYDLYDFTKLLLNKDSKNALAMVDKFFMSGMDMNLFLSMYFEFLLNLQKYLVLQDKSVSNLPDDILEDCNVTMGSSVRTYCQKLYILLNSPKVNVKNLLEAWVIERCI